MHEPELLILDEPIAGLDPLVQQSFHALLGEVSAAGPHGVPLLAHALRGRARHPPPRDPAPGPAGGRRLAREPPQGRVQRLEIEFAEPVEADEFRALPGVTEVRRPNGRTLTIGFEGSADAVVKAAAAHEVRAIRPHEDDLEDIFLRYYQEPTS